MAEPLAPQYDPHSIEKPLYREWEERGYFHADPDAVLSGARKPYVIVIPPPNVTAVLHMGHGLNNTVQDVLVRWRRMQGYEALWMPGSDHAGIATQNVVERIVAKEGKTRFDLGREAFVQRVWDFVDETGSTILEQLRAIGSSCDWSRTRFTLDEGLSRAVREVFVELYEKGRIYKGYYIINWCPRCLTALSDEEAEPTETQGKLWHLRYPLTAASAEAAGNAGAGLPTLPDGRPYLVVATTRPETMLGDTAVAVHPEDGRYAALVGGEVELPLTGRTVPIVADSFVDPEFGTGAVKVTPAHDPNDFELSRRHAGVAAMNIMTPEAVLTDDVPVPFRGLDRFEARKRVVEALRVAGLLERIDDHVHAVPHCYRCDTIVEPRLSEQWFVRMAPLAAPALAASREGRVRFTPERWTKVYEHWLENIRDWCISRQLWWGHRIPAWYCRNPECAMDVIVSREDPTSCPQCGGTELVQDPDVLDTWFSSWLWPFSTMGWPDETKELKAFYPTDTLSTAPEILFFWVARMVMAGLEFRGVEPFHDVYLHGTVRDAHGRKMSKSLGNGIDPLVVVDRFGADALRYTVLSSMGVGTDIFLDHEDLEETFAPGRNFSNKLWNAARFALLNLEGETVRDVAELGDSLELADRWILSRLAAATDEVTRSLETFRFHEVTEAIRGFFWGEVADWYLELVKGRLRGEAGEASREAAKATLVAALDGLFRLAHPVVPFITETLWRRLPVPEGAQREESLVIARWPEGGAERRDLDAEARMEALMELIGTVRTLRGEYNVPPGTEIELRLGNVSAELRDAIAAEERAVRRLAKIGSMHIENGGGTHGGAGAHAVLRGGAEIFLPLEGIIDIARERDRLAKELDRLRSQLRGTEAKLSNEKFTGKAPEEVVQYERDKATSLRDQCDRLAGKLAALS